MAHHDHAEVLKTNPSYRHQTSMALQCKRLYHRNIPQMWKINTRRDVFFFFCLLFLSMDRLHPSFWTSLKENHIISDSSHQIVSPYGSWCCSTTAAGACVRPSTWCSHLHWSSLAQSSTFAQQCKCNMEFHAHVFHLLECLLFLSFRKWSSHQMSALCVPPVLDWEMRLKAKQKLWIVYQGSVSPVCGYSTPQALIAK